MGAADEITHMYAVNRAYVLTFTARGTFVIIYTGEVVYDLYGAGGTGLFALAAGYAAVLAEFSDLLALVMIVTLNYYAGNILNEMDYTVGTGRSAKTAADALLGIYLGYASVGDHDSISGTNLGAVTVAKTSKGAESVTCEVHICRLTGLRT